MEIGFPFMGDRLSLCRYSWAKRLTVYSFIFSFLWVSFPRYSYSFVPAIAAVAARAVIPKVVGRVLVRRFAANDAIYTASQLTATRVFVGRAAANAAEYLPAASSYKMSGVATWAGIAAAVSSFVPSSLSSSDGSVMVMTNGKKISDNLYEVTYSGQSGESKTITVNFEPQELSPVILHVSRNNVDAGSPVVGVETGYSTPDNALYYYQDSKELIYYYGDNPTEIARNYLNDYNSRTYTETLTNFERTVTNKVVNSNGDVSFTEQNYKFTYPSSFYEIPEITHLYSNPAASSFPAGIPMYENVAGLPMYYSVAYLTAGKQYQYHNTPCKTTNQSNGGYSTICAVPEKLNKVKLPEAISLIYSEVLKVPYMLDPQLVNDERMITFRLTPDIDEREFVTRYLGNMNIRIWTKKGVDFIAPYTPKEPVKPRYTWTYTPQYRSVAYLSDILGGYVSGSFNNSGAVISDDSLKGSSGASNYINRTGDILVYYGTKEDIAILKTLVTSLDTMSDEVVVSGYVFEVQTSQSDGSGILLAAKILSDKFNISVGAAGLDNFINIRTGSIDAIFNLLKTDSRFTVVSAPRLRVKNNASASFSVGSDVPVLGSVTVNNNTTTQSVEYRSSGVLFNVTPSIKSRTMDLKIQQQLSNFVTTETGVNNSPTLIKRDVTTEVSLADGDIILLGGLAEQKDSKASSGWSFFGSRTSESNKTDIMVMLQVRKVDRSRATPRSAARSGELFRDNLN